MMNDKAIMLSPFASVKQFDQVQPMATALSHSRFVPQMFRGENAHADCIMALGIASRLGADVLSVMNALYDVHGKIGFEAKFLIACVNASGKFDPIRWRFEGEEGKDSWGARAYATDRQSGDELIGTLVTIDMAKKEGWFGKKGSKWQTMPEQMLRYRSASFWISTYAGEYAMGMRTAEDLQDEPVIEAPQAEVVSSRPTRRQKPKDLTEMVEQQKQAPKRQGIDVQAEVEAVAKKMWPQEYKTVICKKASAMFKQDIEAIEQMTPKQLSDILDDLNEIRTNQGGAI
jgi:hypothetical protein